MGSQGVEILRQGIWASLSGGWYHDPHQSVFCNSFHLYLWLYLVCVPFLVYLLSSVWWPGWIAHLILLAVISSIIKVTNFLLHYMFDTGESKQEVILSNIKSSQFFQPGDKVEMAAQSASSFETFEMQVVDPYSQREHSAPSADSNSWSLAAVAENEAAGSQLPRASDLQVDVHHKDNSGSEDAYATCRGAVLNKRVQFGEGEWKLKEGSSGRGRLRSESELYLDLPIPMQQRGNRSLKELDTVKYGFTEKGPGSSHGTRPKLKDNSIVRVEDTNLRKKSGKNLRQDDISDYNSDSDAHCKDSNSPLILSRNNPVSKLGNSDEKRKYAQNLSQPHGYVPSCLGDENLETSSHNSTPRVAKMYHPIVCHAVAKGNSSKKGNSPYNKNDSLKVTTLTFENVYADDENPARDASGIKISSSSMNELSDGLRKTSHFKVSQIVETLSAEKIKSEKSKDSPKKRSFNFENEPKEKGATFSDSIDEYEAACAVCEDVEPIDVPKLNIDPTQPPSDSDSSESSSPDIDWLFCHSDSDSEFSNVGHGATSFENVKHKAIRDDCPTAENSSVKSNVGSSLESFETPRVESESTKSSNSSQANLRDPLLARQGAIPKQKRHGVIVVDNSMEGGESEPKGDGDNCDSAGVTMDLVRKMLDVFSSYQESRTRDIKKFLVLVSLEQEGSGPSRESEYSEPIHDIVSSHSEVEGTEDESCSVKVHPHDQLFETDSSSMEKLDRCENVSVLQPVKKHSQSFHAQSGLHRKPAVRRRRQNSANQMMFTSPSDHSLNLDYNSMLMGKINEQHSYKESMDKESIRARDFSGRFSDYLDDENLSAEIVDSSRSKKVLSKRPLPRVNDPSFKDLRYDLALPYSSTTTESVHMATSHEDTSDGAVHYFQDDQGCWFSYKFKVNSSNSKEKYVQASKDENVGAVSNISSWLGDSTSSATSATKSILPDTINTRTTENDKSVHDSDLSNFREDASLSSSSMSLCSGLTVVLDSQANPHPSSPIWASREVPQNGPSHHVMKRCAITPPSSTSTPPPPARPPPPPTFRPSLPTHLQILNLATPSNPLQLFTNVFLERRRIGHRMSNLSGNSLGATNINGSSMAASDATYMSVDIDVDSINRQLKFTSPLEKTITYHKLKLCGKKTIRISFDRLSLLALLDRNVSVIENMFSIFLIVLVGVLGCLVLLQGFYHELYVFLFCVIMASCQYSLFKSVQPDAASPTHGYNHIISYSRPVYFCFCCSIVLLLEYCLQEAHTISFVLYGLDLTTPAIITNIRNGMLIFLLCFPLIFSFGLLPQINTFFMYILEQIDMHIFGGNAVTSLSSAIYCVLRSIVAVVFLVGFAYAGLAESAGSQHILYSIFCSLLLAVSYHLSRAAADPKVLFELVKKHMFPEEWATTGSEVIDEKHNNVSDPLPEKMRKTLSLRLMQDMIVCSLTAVISCALHSSTIFTVLLQGDFPDILISLWMTASLLGFLNHYLIPQLRKQQPWMYFARPILRVHEYSQFEAYNAAKIMWFEKGYVWLCILEKHIIYPLLFLCALTKDAKPILEKHPHAGTVMIVISGLKCIRSSYSQLQLQLFVLSFTLLLFNFDLYGLSETFLIDYFFVSILVNKGYELILKVQFIVSYIAPWQITWGSAFHAFAQPFSVPHSAMLFMQAVISSILSTPLNPVLGSAIFITSYVRPVKFWERDYNTRRMDQSNTRLSTLLEHNPGADDNNLNSIFYEHLTRSLQHSLCGDILMGRWGPCLQGDIFVLASDNLNCLVHIIEIGNGLVTFQVRGLEFRGTYCQQREVEAISEGVEEDGGCCCCEPGHFQHCLSANAAFNQRWLAWEVTATKYVLEGYSVSDNSATSMFQMFALRKILVTYYVKSIIFYLIQSAKLNDWLNNADIIKSLSPLNEPKFADLDPTFHIKTDEDFDLKESGITRKSFLNVYQEWILFCLANRTQKEIDKNTSKDSLLVSLCLGLSLLGRRALGQSSQCDQVDVFLQFLHSLFKGDIRPQSLRDEWVFRDMELLREVLSPAIRMSLKLHQDHFLLPDEYESCPALHRAILDHQKNWVICHEGDPQWRAAVLAGRPSLLSLRHVNDDGEDKFKILMLNKRFLLFRIIKVNRECVRGLWAGQQQELVYLRNRNPERGSIQNAKQALRNIINSSCDQPIGYPIYVSPLTTSYSDTHDQLPHITGRTITPKIIKDSVFSFGKRVRDRCIQGCSSGSSGLADECGRLPDSCQANLHLHQVLSSMPVCLSSGESYSSSHHSLPPSLSHPVTIPISRGSLPHPLRGSLMSTLSSLVERQKAGFPPIDLNLVGTVPVSSGTVSKLEPVDSETTFISPPSISHFNREVLLQHQKRIRRRSQESSSSAGVKFLPREAVADGLGPLDPSWQPPRKSKSRLNDTSTLNSLSSTSSRVSSSSQKNTSGHGSTANQNINSAHQEIGEAFSRAEHVSSLYDLIQAHLYTSNQSGSSGVGISQIPTSQPTPPPPFQPLLDEIQPRKNRNQRVHKHSSSESDPVNIYSKKPFPFKNVRITDANQVYDTLNLGRRIDVKWPSEMQRRSGGRNAWGLWAPQEGMEGQVVHVWVPHHADTKCRSHVDRTILLLKIGHRFVPIAENAVVPIDDIKEQEITEL